MSNVLMAQAWMNLFHHLRTGHNAIDEHHHAKQNAPGTPAPVRNGGSPAVNKVIRIDEALDELERFKRSIA